MNETTAPAWYIVISSLGIYYAKSPIVNTSLGQVQGIVSTSRDGREFYEYRGIPYAKPPTDALRFEAPVPAEPWKGIRKASNWGSPCLQFDALVRGTIVGHEDCLFLNIFTPNLKPTKLLSVLVYIHGGGFTAGESNQFDPKYFMDHQVVVATFNYRLASLGFINTGDELIRGNMGLKDQNMAMRWVKQNVQNFGGNPAKITLFGESAGGASVHYHVISPLSRGLFQKAIMQSGNLGCPWAMTRNPQHQALRYGRLLNCAVDNTSVLVDCLKKMNARDIVKPHVEIMSPVHLQDDFFTGSVEAVVREDTFLSENPLLMVERGDFAHIPVIFGINSGEGGLKTARLESYSHILDELDVQWNIHTPVLMHYDPNRTGVSDKLRNYYFPSNGSSVTRVDPKDNLVSLTKMLSDGLFFEANKRMANFHAKYSPTYLYYFTYQSETLPSTYALIRAAKPQRWYPWEINIASGVVYYYADKYVWTSKDTSRLGACHADDVPQAWSINLATDIRTTSKDYPFSKEFVNWIVQFASNESSAPIFQNLQWPKVNVKKTHLYLKLDRKAEIIKEPFKERVEFIESLNIRDPLDPSNW